MSVAHGGQAIELIISIAPVEILRADILKMILRQGVGVLGIGLGIGLLLAIVGTRAIANLFVGVKPNDALTFVAVGILLAVIALLACWIPARRATRVDPLVALRYE
ncbi:MAG: FtsX-like permease family protein [Candidatus Acidiferrales bacterium]